MSDLTDEQILLIARDHFREDASTTPETLKAYCDSVRSVITSYGLVEPSSGPLSDADIDTIAESMPGGMDGFLKGWGWRNFARAVEAEALLFGSVVPEGFALVPIKPTQAMCQAGQEKAREWPRFPLRIVPIWQAMIASTPTETKHAE